MGYSKNTWKIFNKYLKITNLLNSDNLPDGHILISNEKYYGKEMLELGCQSFRHPGFNPKEKMANKYFNSIGIKCTSIDIKNCGDAEIVDLKQPIDMKYHNHFDIITNSGTTEHVSELNGQYSAFKNIHLCSKLNGIMLHFVPAHGYPRKPHSDFDYNDGFFEILAKLNNYKIISIEKYDRKKGDLYWGVCFRKIKNSIFTIEKEKLYKNIKIIKKV